MPSRMGVALPLADLTEKEWAAQGVQLAKTLGWRRFHTYRSDRSEPGWPDEAFLRERLVLVEWKTERGKPSPAQVDWLTALAAAGCETYLARPADLDELAKVLSRRWDFTPYGLIGPGTERHWQPGSLWTPDGCRHDQRTQAA